MPSRSQAARTWPELLGPLLGGDHDGVRDILADALRSGPSRCTVYETLLTPCLHEIGALWQRRELTVPDEHLAAETVIQVVNELRSPSVTNDDAPTAVVCCAPLEGHTLPALLAGDLLTDAGWRVWYLGSSAPPKELAAFVLRREPRLLVLTSTLARTAAGIAAVTGALDGARRPAILAGGAGVRGISSPARLGADAFGHRFADLLAFAGSVAADRTAHQGAAARPPLRRPPRQGLPLERVELVLREAATTLSITEICERCDATAAQVGSVLTHLEGARRVRFTGGRWAAVGLQPPRDGSPGTGASR